MNREQFEGNWHLLKGKIKEKWGKLTDDDVAQINGKYEQFLGKLQKKYGYTKEQAERESNSWKYEERNPWGQERGEGQHSKSKTHCSSCGSDSCSCENKQHKKHERHKDDEFKEKKRKAG